MPTDTSTVTETAPYTWALSYGEYVATVAKIEKINARAVAKGFTGRLEVVGTRTERKSVDTLTGLEITEIYWATSVTGTAPSYGGYTFLARIDRVGESFIISSAPGVDHVDRSLVRAGECDHCGMNRQRNNTYLVRNDATGQVVNVGSTCIKDFLGWSAGVVFFSDSDMEPAEVSGGPDRLFSVDSVLATSVAAIKAHGWVPASSYDGRPTRDIVALALVHTNLNPVEKAMVEALRPFADEATSLVADIKAYILSDDFAGQSTYVDNLKVLVAQDAVSARQFGLLASAPNALTRHLGQVAERKAKESKAEGSVFVGAIKDKVEVKGTIENVHFIHGNYGTTTLYTILGEDGNLFKWFSSNGVLGDDAGVAVHIQGTVKAHDEYRGTKSTVLTRCKSLMPVEASDVKTDGYGNRII